MTERKLTQDVSEMNKREFAKYLKDNSDNTFWVSDNYTVVRTRLLTLGRNLLAGRIQEDNVISFHYIPLKLDEALVQYAFQDFCDRMKIPYTIQSNSEFVLGIFERRATTLTDLINKLKSSNGN